MLNRNLRGNRLKKLHIHNSGALSLRIRQASTVKYQSVFVTHSNISDEHKHLFSTDFLRFLRRLSGEFNPHYYDLLATRKKSSHFLKETNISMRADTAWIRNDLSWKGPSVIPSLAKRHVEITGPAGDRKMMINALNSGANIYMTDLEDSQSPEWFAMVQAYQNIFDACHDKLTFKTSEKTYSVNKDPAVMIVRPRGLHMFEHHVVDESGRPMPAGLVDIAMYMYHNGKTLYDQGKAPLLYQPKLESFEEAVLIHDIVQQIELHLGIPYGTTRITALIETLPGILQAEEIGYGLGKYWAGLNAGRWDYIFSVIKNRCNDVHSVYPDRNLLTMKTPFMTNYLKRIVQVCHSRGVSAIGGMSAFIPSKDAIKHEEILSKVTSDKEYELKHGCDGAWVAHPGLVQPIAKVFQTGLAGKANQIDNLPVETIRKEKFEPASFYTIPKDLASVNNYTEQGLRTNVKVGVEYIAAWLSGSGAVALHGLMEDMATAEISRSQVWQWLKHRKQFIRLDGSVTELNTLLFSEIYEDELNKLKINVEKTANSVRLKQELLRNLKVAGEIFNKLVNSEEISSFVQDIASTHLNEHVLKPIPLRKKFTAMKFTEEEKQSLRGTKPDITLDARLSIQRGETFNRVMHSLRSDGLVAHGSFIGTPNGHSARNVVEGGLGNSWPYIGGWELNARGLHLGQPMPDTLAVSFTEQGDLAVIINRFLEVADRVQELELKEDLEKISKLPEGEQAKAKAKLIENKVDYLTQPMLADLEQGWGDPKKVFLSVIRCLQNGVNIMHIEDQYSLKRCGHLGGKGLDDINGWKVTFKAANLAANLFHGVKMDGPNQNINFVARTDALSAEFIQYSNHMHNKDHPDHPFIDWDRGFTADGRYLYLKKGTNPNTGVKYGLEHSAVRCAEIVKAGLASHVWMETPGANTEEARLFMDQVNHHLAPHGVFARGLYNHSPSFVWDVSFFVEAQGIAKALTEYIKSDIDPMYRQGKLEHGKAHWMVKEWLKQNGDRSRGDYYFNDDFIAQILGNGLDLAVGEVDWKENIRKQMDAVETFKPTLQGYKTKKELQRILSNGFKPLRHITNVIVRQRLYNFKNKLSDAGFEVHLCTLPLYPSDAYTASNLARGMTLNGIHDFVILQRTARKYDDETGKLTSFFHQKATGTGWEVHINKIVGTSNTDILAGSTEVADHEKEKQLKDNHTGPSTYHH